MRNTPARSGIARLSLALAASLLPALFLWGCDAGQADSKDLDPDVVYLDYRIICEMHADRAVMQKKKCAKVRLYYRKGSAYGTTIAMTNPAEVHLEEERLSLRKPWLMGSFYQKEYRPDELLKKRQVRYTDKNGEQQTHDISYEPIYLETKIPTSISNDSLTLRFSGLKDGTLTKCQVTHLASKNAIDLPQPVNGVLVVPASTLQLLGAGNLVFEFNTSHSRELDTTTRAGGRLLTMTNIKVKTHLLDPNAIEGQIDPAKAIDALPKPVVQNPDWQKQLVGTWTYPLSNGETAIHIFRADGTAARKISNGSWKKEGNRIKVTWARKDDYCYIPLPITTPNTKLELKNGQTVILTKQ